MTLSIPQEYASIKMISKVNKANLDIFIIGQFQNAVDALTIDVPITHMVKRHLFFPDAINSTLNRVKSF